VLGQLEEEEGPLGWLGHMGSTCRISGWANWAKSQEKSFQNKIGILETAKDLGICTKRFRRNFYVGIFPKFF
jgi:hypothetical protein